MRAVIRQPGLILSLLVVILAIGFAVAPQVFASHDPLDGNAADRFSPPSGDFWFGTDNLGRDVYSRVVHGAWLSLTAAGAAVVLGVSLGAIIGLLSGYLGGAVDFVLMRIVDVLIAVPGILLALIVVAALGFGPTSVALGVGFGAAGSFARVMRSQVVRVRTAEFVEAARTMGVRWPSILLRHVLPNTARPVIAMAALELGTAILGVSALSFLGFGAQPPAPEWGSLVSAGRDFVSTSWWLSVLPGTVILVVVLAVNRLSKAIGGQQ